MCIRDSISGFQNFIHGVPHGGHGGAFASIANESASENNLASVTLGKTSMYTKVSIRASLANSLYKGSTLQNSSLRLLAIIKS